MFLFGLSAAVCLLHAVGMVENWEENNLRNPKEKVCSIDS